MALSACDPDRRERLIALADWIAAAAYPIGLTNYATPSAVLQHGIAPTLALADALGTAPTGLWADLGPGAGTIGVALAIAYPLIQVDLVDRRQRVASFLDVTLRRFKLANARSVLADLDETPSDAYDGVCFRALMEPAGALGHAKRAAQHWVAAWHSPGVAAYAAPPVGLEAVICQPTTSDGLVLSLYRRV